MSITDFETLEFYESEIIKQGFSKTETWDYTDKIRHSALRMYRAAFPGAIVSEIYNFFKGQKVSRFAKKHYLCGYYQYKSLQAGLWRYKIIKATK